MYRLVRSGRHVGKVAAGEFSEVEFSQAKDVGIVRSQRGSFETSTSTNVEELDLNLLGVIARGPRVRMKPLCNQHVTRVDEAPAVGFPSRILVQHSARFPSNSEACAAEILWAIRVSASLPRQLGEAMTVPRTL